MAYTLTDEEIDSLPYWQRQHYYKHAKYCDYKCINGKLHIVHYPPPRISWERFNELRKGLMLEDYQRTDKNTPHVVLLHCNADDWNPHGRPYTEYGFEYRLTLDVRGGNEHGEEAEQREQGILADWLLAHGATEEELKGIYYNWHGYSCTFVCRFTEVPHEHLPAKMLKWLKKNPQWKHKVLKPEHKEA